jgi:CubicO group peptidase (beta-lactamase class C family)
MFGRRQPPPPPPPLLQRAQNVPLDQLMRMPSAVNVPCTNCHSSATKTFCCIPCKCPIEVLPLSFVRLKNAPLLLIDACLAGSPCAHQAPKNPEACPPCGDAEALLVFDCDSHVTRKPAAKSAAVIEPDKRLNCLITTSDSLHRRQHAACSHELAAGDLRTYHRGIPVSTKLLKTILVALLCSVSTAAQQAQIKRLDGSTITPAEIDATVTHLMSAAEVPGVGLALLNGGKVAYLKAYGFRDKEKNLPLTPDSIMSGASFTKVAFAYMVLQLADRGILDLDKPVFEYLPKALPEYPKYSDLANDDRYKLITARMLLSHTSGFANWRWIEGDRKLKIHFDPGSRYAYSGEGIDLLQLIVEAITKQPLEKLMQDQVFEPCAMTRTSMVWQERFEDNYANGYDEYGRSLGPQKRPTADAAGSLLTTPRDFAAFLQAVMAGKGLSEPMREQMLKPQVQIFSKHEFPTLDTETTDENKFIRLSYGLGWGLYWTPYGEAFFKEGHDDSWRNYTVCFAKPGTGILIMTNSGNGEGIYKSLLETLLKNNFTPIEWEGFTPYDQLPPRTPLKPHTEIHVKPEVLAKYLGRYGDPPNLILVVRREGDHLSIQENVEPKQEVFAESERDFFSKVADDVFTFQLDNQGHVTGLVLHTGGQHIPIKRID